MRVTKDLLGDTMDPHKAARTDRRGVDETRTERTADLPNIINVQLERHRRDLIGDSVDPHKAARIYRRSVDET